MCSDYLPKYLQISHWYGKAQTLGDFDYRYIFSESIGVCFLCDFAEGIDEAAGQLFF